MEEFAMLDNWIRTLKGTMRKICRAIWNMFSVLINLDVADFERKKMENGISRYDYYLGKLVDVIAKKCNGEVSLIFDSDIKAAKEIAKECCGGDELQEEHLQLCFRLEKIEGWMDAVEEYFRYEISKGIVKGRK